MKITQSYLQSPQQNQRLRSDLRMINIGNMGSFQIESQKSKILEEKYNQPSQTARKKINWNILVDQLTSHYIFTVAKNKNNQIEINECNQTYLEFIQKQNISQLEDALRKIQVFQLETNQIKETLQKSLYNHLEQIIENIDSSLQIFDDMQSSLIKKSANELKFSEISAIQMKLSQNQSRDQGQRIFGYQDNGNERDFLCITITKCEYPGKASVTLIIIEPCNELMGHMQSLRNRIEISYNFIIRKAREGQQMLKRFLDAQDQLGSFINNIFLTQESKTQSSLQKCEIFNYQPYVLSRQSKQSKSNIINQGTSPSQNIIEQQEECQLAKDYNDMTFQDKNDKFPLEKDKIINLKQFCSSNFQNQRQDQSPKSDSYPQSIYTATFTQQSSEVPSLPFSKKIQVFLDNEVAQQYVDQNSYYNFKELMFPLSGLLDQDSKKNKIKILQVIQNVRDILKTHELTIQNQIEIEITSLIDENQTIVTCKRQNIVHNLFNRKFKQIMMNLIFNSIQYFQNTPDNEKVIKIKISEIQNDIIQIQITDSSSGLKKESIKEKSINKIKFIKGIYDAKLGIQAVASILQDIGGILRVSPYQNNDSHLIVGTVVSVEIKKNFYKKNQQRNRTQKIIYDDIKQQVKK